MYEFVSTTRVVVGWSHSTSQKAPPERLHSLTTTGRVDRWESMSRRDKRPAYSSTARVSTANPVASWCTTDDFVTPTADPSRICKPDLAQEAWTHSISHRFTARNYPSEWTCSTLFFALSDIIVVIVKGICSENEISTVLIKLSDAVLYLCF